MPELHHLALRVADPERSALFYGDVLGLPEMRRFPDGSGGLRSIWLRMGAGVLMLEKELKGEGAAMGSGHVLALGIDDLARWEGRLAAAGTRVDERTEYTLFLRDPDGHRVGLSVYRFG